MGFPWESSAGPIVGRRAERQVLVDALSASAAHEPQVVLVHGEAGVGKTRLVRELCLEAAGAHHVVLWGNCVRLDAASVPLAPITGALQGWLTTLTKPDRAAVLSGVSGLPGLLPRTRPEAGGVVPGDLLREVDLVLHRACDRASTLLVVDDLQWADLTSLDALAYVISGLRDEPLLVIATSRSEVGEFDALRGWFADLRRSPLVSEIFVSRLTPSETRDQVSLILGEEPSAGLIRQVQQLSKGNAYFTELLVDALPSDVTQLPPDLPEVLKEAVLAAWRRLSPETRGVLQVLSVSGRSTSFDVLAQVVATAGMSVLDLSRCLDEAAGTGAVLTHGGKEYTFHHPLLAEVLYATLTPAESRAWHAAFVGPLSSQVYVGRDGSRFAGELALHHQRAGHADAAYDYSTVAAEHAAGIRAYPEAALHLQRALDVLPDLTPEGRAGVDVAGLLGRAAKMFEQAGDLDSALDLIDRAGSLVSADDQPLEVARLLCDWSDLMLYAGRAGQLPLDETIRAVALTDARPDSPVRARALAGASEAHSWRGSWTDARELADLAVAAATRSDSAAAMSIALAAREHAWHGDARAATDVEESYRLAVETGDGLLIARASLHRMNFYDGQGELRRVAEVLREGLSRSLAAGGSVLNARLQDGLGAALLMLADHAGARAALREVLAAGYRSVAGTAARLNSALLALRVGHLDEASTHLRRAREMADDIEGSSNMYAFEPIAELLIANGRPSEVAPHILRALETHVGDPRVMDRALCLGACAYAAEARAARDRDDPTRLASARRSLESIIQSRTAISPTAFSPAGPHDHVQLALGGIFDAAVSSCAGEDEAEQWRIAASDCHEAGLRWQEADSLLRLAESCLGDKPRSALLATALRTAHQIASEIGAALLKSNAEELALIAHISLERPPKVAAQPVGEGRLSDLTSREREILGHLVAGRTYREIGEALFISPKTVSAHVSHILVKTSTTNSTEVTGIARRAGLFSASEDSQPPPTAR